MSIFRTGRATVCWLTFCFLLAAPGFAAEATLAEGAYVKEDVRDATRRYGSVAVNLASLELNGFQFTKAKNGEWLKAIVTEQPASVELRFGEPGAFPMGDVFSGRVFLGFDDRFDPACTGKERVVIYHNNVELGAFDLNYRHAQPHAYPISWPLADEEGKVGMELSFEDGQLHFRLGATTLERRTFKKGDVLKIEAATPGAYFLTDLLLLQSAEGVAFRRMEVRYPEFRQLTDTLQFAWVTTLPSKAEVIYGTDRKAVSEGKSGGIPAGERFAENQQVFLPVKPGSPTPVFVKVVGKTNAGASFESGIFEFAGVPKQDPPKERRLPLELAGPVQTDLPRPALASIPLPPGEVFDPANIGISDRATSGEAPTQQMQVSSRYPDGSIRVAVANFNHAPGHDYDVRIATDPAKSTGGLTLSQEGKNITVQNQHGVFLFSGESSAGFTSIAPEAGGTLRPDLVLTDAEGRTYRASAPGTLQIEQNGPAKVVVKASGRFADKSGTLFEYIARWSVYDGLPGVDLELTIGNDEPEIAQKMYAETRTITRFRSLTCDWSAEKQPIESATLQTAANPISLKSGQAATQVDESSLVHSGSNGPVKARMEGIQARLKNDMLMAASVEDCWQQYPKSFGFDADAIRIGLFPALDGIALPVNSEADRIQRIFFVKNDMYRVMAGVQKTHTVSFYFGPDAWKLASGKAVLGSQLLLAPPPVEMCATGLFGPMSPRIDGRHKLLEEWIDRHLEAILGQREKNREFGLLNFGDYFGERGVNWGNMEYDPAQSGSLMFLRTGKKDWFDLGYAAALHQADVDTVHYGPNRGLQVMHAGGHTGREYFADDGMDYNALRKATGSRAPYNQTFHAGHMWIFGMANYAALTGSQRLRDVVELFGKRRAEAVTYFLSSSNHRGWNLMAFAALYALDSNPFYLNAARISVERYEKAYDPVEGHLYGYSYEHNTIGTVHRSALWLYTTLTGDPRGFELLEKSLSTLDDGFWDDQLAGAITLHHGWWPKRRGDPNWTLVLGWAATHLQAEKWKQRLLDTLGDGLGVTLGNPKDAYTTLQFAGYYSKILDQLGIDASEIPPLPDAIRKIRSQGGRRGIEEEPPPTTPAPATKTTPPMKKTVAALATAATLAAAPANAQYIDDLRQAFDMAITDKQAFVRLQAVEIMSNDAAAPPVVGGLNVPTGWKRITLKFVSHSGSATNANNRLAVGLDFLADGAESPALRCLITLRQARENEMFLNVLTSIHDATGAEIFSAEEHLAGGPSWFPPYSGRAEAEPLVLDIVRSSETKATMTLTGPGEVVLAQSEMELPAAGEIKLSAHPQPAERQSVGARFTDLLIE